MTLTHEERESLRFCLITIVSNYRRGYPSPLWVFLALEKWDGVLLGLVFLQRISSDEQYDLTEKGKEYIQKEAAK